MNLFDINDEIQGLIDPETGEIADFEKFESLQMQFSQKIENTVLYIKELRSFADALKDQKDSFEKRYRTITNQADRLTDYVRMALGGNRFETAMCRVTPRNYSSAQIDNEEQLIDWAIKNDRKDLLTFRDPEISKSAVSEALKKGEELPYCRMEEKQSIIIK